MLEEFIQWYSNSDFIIHQTLRDELGYVEYTVVFGLLGVIAILFQSIKSAVKDQKFGVSNSYLVGIILLFMLGTALKPTMDGIAWLTKKTDEVTNLSEADKTAIITVKLYRKKAELSNNLDSLLQQNNGEWTAGLAYKQLQIWTTEFKMASSLIGASNIGVMPSWGFSIERTLEQLIGGIRGLLKIYYIAMMNLLYLVIPLAYVFSVFKPSHFLKPLGLFVLYGFVLTIINFVEWVIFVLFLEQTIDTNSLGSMIFSTGAVLYDLLSILLYLKAMWLTRLIFPIPEEDVIGPMAGQALALTTYAVMSRLKIPGAVKPKPQSGGSGKTQGPVEVTTK